MADVKKYLSYDKLQKYDSKIKGVITAGDEATLAAAKSYADGLADNYDAAGSASTAEANAKSYTDTEVAKANSAAAAAQAQADKGVADAATADGKAVAAQTAVDTLAGKVGTVPEGSTVMGIIANIQENAYDDTAIQQAVATLEANKADKTQVATDIASAKTELEGKISAKADQTALDAVSAVANAAVAKTVYDAKVAELVAEDERIAGLVASEAERAAAAEKELDERLEGVEAFFVTAEGETLDAAMDTLVEIQKYITEDGAAADEMVKDIAANAKAIEDMDAAYKLADQTLQGNIDTLSGTVDTKAAQADLEALEERVEANEGAIEENAGAIAALEAKFGDGEGSVADMIADAVAAEAGLRETGVNEAKAAASTADGKAVAAAEAAAEADRKAVAAQGEVDALEAVVAGKAAQADLETLAGRVTTEEGKVSTLQTEMDAVEALAAANDAAIKALQTASATHATKAELQAENERAVARENAIEAKVDSFVEISETEINQLFQ